MPTNRPELWDKLNALVNKYGGVEGFVAHMDEWPRTIREMVFGSTKLMEKFGMIETIEQPEGEDSR